MKTFEFDGEKYKSFSFHQQEWGTRIIKELNLKGYEVILDLGCGDGRLSKILSELVPNGKVIGIDASKGMINSAKAFEGNNLWFKVMDINNIDIDEEIDIIFSNATLHWIKDHNRLLDNCYGILKRNGRIRFNFAGEGNCSYFIRVVKEVMNNFEFREHFRSFDWPWYMPDIEGYRTILRESKFEEFEIWEENADRFFKDEVQLTGWIDQPSIVPFLDHLNQYQRKSFRDEVVEKMIKLSKQDDGRCFETFRRINVLSRK